MVASVWADAVKVAQVSRVRRVKSRGMGFFMWVDLLKIIFWLG